ncbi:hypothetical protein RFI_30467 [Reticulomyxa filosa]|uniref:Uncharacterized protein n=1 Tax=Reticulomyxa filosa TaxID=46433 RepID=X6M1T5_RETFI|nr:hypothetical protein RFI_30467 [Reticulomyxa filosa]|eukprot:ETO06925.1 hypothetical protein RFI_30467 [Reticulomyxa filosa]
MDSNDENTGKENVSKAQDRNKTERNGKEGEDEEETKKSNEKSEERKAFGDVTSLLHQWQNISSNGRKDKLEELSRLSPQKNLKRQLYEKRQQMLQMQTKVHFFFFFFIFFF